MKEWQILKNHSLFEWELYYFCSFCKCEAHDMFSDVVSGFHIEVYSHIYPCITRKG